MIWELIIGNRKKMIKKCRIQKYDPNVLKAPYEFVTLIEEVEVYQPEFDSSGIQFANNLQCRCYDLGYSFRFYSTSSVEGIDFDIIVRGELEDKLGVW